MYLKYLRERESEREREREREREKVGTFIITCKMHFVIYV